MNQFHVVKHNLCAVVLACAAVALLAAVSQAAIMTAEPDSFPVDTNISNSFPGIDLISVGPGYDGDFDPNIFARDSLAHLEPFVASTGRLVFGTNDSSFPTTFGGFGDAILRVDFTNPTNLVMLDAIGNDSSDFARLQAYTAGNALIDTYDTGSMGTSKFETMTVSSAMSDIAYVLASGRFGDSVGFDNLRFEGVIPEASTALLAVIAALAAPTLRRRRK
jgi:hypothetical protein